MYLNEVERFSPRLKNKAFCKQLKRWVESLLFSQIYAVLNQKMSFSK